LRLLVLVDGEHHPAAVRDALDAIASGGSEVAGALFCGGTEKVDAGALDAVYGVPVLRPDATGDELITALGHAIDHFRPDGVLDLTDEPVLSPPDRFRLASVALGRGVTFGGADFEFRPPSFANVLTKPSIRVFATGKRTGKTAVASALARHAIDQGRSPVIVAVGRGGPNPPRVIEAGTTLDTKTLLEMVDQGLHASSDYVEDALTSGATTIGCVRVGGGLAGATITSNVVAAAKMAQERPEDLVLLEGSGASIPEVAASAGVVCVPASRGDAVTKYLDPYRLLLADLAVVTMAEHGSAAATTTAAIHGSAPGLDVIHVVFRPEPLADVNGRKAFFCTTAPTDAGSVLKTHLEREHGCEVVGMTHKLSDRAALRRDLAEADAHDVVLVELKAAAIDVAARMAVEQGREVVFVNNAVVGTNMDGETSDVAGAFDKLIERSAVIDRSVANVQRDT
jgi:cyclic 2,3-diphosphoglycerate synthetase